LVTVRLETLLMGHTTLLPNDTLERSSAMPPTTPVHQGYRAVFRNRNFMALWSGQVLSQIADRVVFVVFVAMIVHQFGPEERYSSLLYVAFTIPAILLTALAGVFVDRWPRRAVLVTTNLIRGALLAFLPLAAHTGLLAIYGLAFLLSTATQFFVPAEAATIPTVVEKSQLMTANSLFTTTMIGSVVFGFALGDPMINIFSLHQVHWAIVVLFFMAAGCLALVKVPPACVIDPQHHSVPGGLTVPSQLHLLMDEMKIGVKAIWKDHRILYAILKLALLFSTVVALCILFISFAKAFLYTNPLVAAQKFAYIITYSGLGMVLGAFVVGRFCRNARRSRLVYGGFVLMGLMLGLLSWMGQVPRESVVMTLPAWQAMGLYIDAITITARMALTYSLAAMLGFGGALVAVPLQARIHELLPEDKRGKILGVQFTVLSTCSTLPVLVAGFGAEHFGVQTMLLLISIPTLLLGVAGWALHGWRHRIGLAPDW
jgi:MFS family permease